MRRKGIEEFVRKKHKSHDLGRGEKTDMGNVNQGLIGGKKTLDEGVDVHEGGLNHSSNKERQKKKRKKG